MSPWALSLMLAAILSGPDVCDCKRTCSYNDLLKTLNLTNSPGAKVRPVKNWKKETTVWLDVLLYSVINLDTSMQILTTFTWFTMVWDNEFVSWNPDDFCGIERLYVSSDYFWKPDVHIEEM
ncbi:5-hydroxytryptamine receptor 3A-like [Discoglossus pictus]